MKYTMSWFVKVKNSWEHKELDLALEQAAILMSEMGLDLVNRALGATGRVHGLTLEVKAEDEEG